eukprot:TRINITY_DN4960_c0_g2_i1.p1 TRINITY_DN4960_c0_g2~~TRINITY_DN4960_c0_g2_i1.p1  ORF type:complete len:320 (+),score=11.02 TRINITY_DN4960_c0_g2_i1:146-1105(+)
MITKNKFISCRLFRRECVKYLSNSVQYNFQVQHETRSFHPCIQEPVLSNLLKENGIKLKQQAGIVFLVNSFDAGPVISNWKNFMKYTDKDLQLNCSSPNIFYPGTTGRIFIISGSSQSLFKCLSLLFPFLQYTRSQYLKQINRFQFQLLVPLKLSSKVIGQHGKNLEYLQYYSLLDQIVTQKPYNLLPQNDCMIFSLYGTEEQVLKGVVVAMQTCFGDSQYIEQFQSQDSEVLGDLVWMKKIVSSGIYDQLFQNVVYKFKCALTQEEADILLQRAETDIKKVRAYSGEIQIVLYHDRMELSGDYFNVQRAIGFLLKRLG